MSESLITQKTRILLKGYEVAGEPIYYNKISDMFTSGIPDYEGVFYSLAWYLELKDKGLKAGKLQKWHLQRAEKAGAIVLSTDNYMEVVDFFEHIRVNYLYILQQKTAKIRKMKLVKH